MPKPHMEFTLILVFLVVSISCEPSAELPSKMTGSDQSTSAEYQAIECIPDTLVGGEKLTLVMQRPHGGDLAIVNPQGRYFYLSNSRAPQEGGMHTVLESEVFEQLDEYTIDTYQLKAIPFVHGATEEETVFSEPGKYEVRMGENLETTGEVPAYTCIVHFEG